MKDNQKRKIIIIVIAVLLVIGLLGASYAFFTAALGGRETTETITVAGGTMDIIFNGGKIIEVSNIIPDNNPAATKTFTITGNNTTTDLTMPYTLNLAVDENTFSNNALTYTLTSTNTSNSGTIVPSITNQINLPTGNGSYLLGNGEFTTGTNKTHTYTLNIYFPETGANQNENQGKTFKAHIGFAGGEVLSGNVSYNTTNPTSSPVIATITSTREITIPSWDCIKNICTKSYNFNITETVTISDNKGDTANVDVEVINIIDAISLVIDYNPITPTTGDVTVTITANRDITTPDWNCEENICTKAYDKNTTETVTITDNYSNSTNITINVTNILNLKDKILSQGGGGTAITAKGNPNFGAIATATDTGLYATEDEYGTSYYYRGLKDNLNNNLIFGGFQWKIVRINGDGSIRIIYNGTCPENNCTINNTGIETQIGEYVWNTNINDNKYVGYMYGGANGVASTSRAQATTNTTSSNAKIVLDNWYQDNIQGTIYESRIVDNLFCNNRELADATTHNSVFSSSTIGTGFGNSNTAYKATARLYQNKLPSLKCDLKNDRFTVNDITIGNGALNYPIGLIIADEISMAGLLQATDNSTNYLYNDQNEWIMSPYLFLNGKAGIWRIYSTGGISWSYVNAVYGLRPVLNLATETIVSGSGSTTNPFLVQTA